MPSHLIWSTFYSVFKKSKLALFGFACLLFLILTFFLSEPLYFRITGSNPYTIDVLNRYAFPSPSTG